MKERMLKNRNKSGGVRDCVYCDCEKGEEEEREEEEGKEEEEKEEEGEEEEGEGVRPNRTEAIEFVS